MVFTVPAHFDGDARGTVAEAGAIAGWDVLTVINEPLATLSAIFDPAAIPDRKVLVLDVGGRTFDATLYGWDGTRPSVLANGWSTGLGGDAWDERLMTWVARQFRDDPRAEPVVHQRLFERCVEARIGLSTRAEVTIDLEYRGQRLAVGVDRRLLERMTEDLVWRCEELADETLGKAGVLWEDLGQVVLVGGASRMPAIRDRFGRRAGGALFDGLDPDTSVAVGAARVGVSRHR